jgi:transcriptional regulator with XRE-family HTH domain
MKVRMKQLRTEKGWSQQKLAEELGMSIDFVRSIEICRSLPSLKSARRIADVFELKTIDEILETVM